MLTVCAKFCCVLILDFRAVLSGLWWTGYFVSQFLISCLQNLQKFHTYENNMAYSQARSFIHNTWPYCNKCSSQCTRTNSNAPKPHYHNKLILTFNKPYNSGVMRADRENLSGEFTQRWICKVQQTTCNHTQKDTTNSQKASVKQNSLSAFKHYGLNISHQMALECYTTANTEKFSSILSQTQHNLWLAQNVGKKPEWSGWFN